MPRKAEGTPTVTEGRSKRTPKPNLKYAMDFVQTIRAVSPDKAEGDDDYKPAPKKRLLDDSLSPSGKVSKNKSLVPTIRLSKVGTNESPKSPAVRKTPGKIEKKSSPAPSKLATIRAGLVKQGMSIVKPGRPMKKDMSPRAAKTSTSENESDEPSKRPTRSSGGSKVTPPTKAIPIPAKPMPGKTVQKQEAPPAKSPQIAKATPPATKDTLPAKGTPQTTKAAPPAKPTPLTKPTSPLAKVTPKVKPKVDTPRPKGDQPKKLTPAVRGAAKDTFKKIKDPILVDEDFLDEDPFGEDKFQLVDINKIIGGDPAPKRKLDPLSGNQPKAKKARHSELIDFEDEISAASLQKASPKSTVKSPLTGKKEVKASSPVTRKQEIHKDARSSPASKDSPKTLQPLRKDSPKVAQSKKEPVVRKESAMDSKNAKKEVPKDIKSTAAKKDAKFSPAGNRKENVKDAKQVTGTKEETIKDIKDEISKMVTEKPSKRIIKKKSFFPELAFEEDIFAGDDSDDDYQTESDDDEDDIEAILTGTEKQKPIKMENKKVSMLIKNDDNIKSKSPVPKKGGEPPKAIASKDIKRDGINSSKAPALARRVTSPDAVAKKSTKPLAESQNQIKAATTLATATSSKEPEKMSGLDKFFILNFPHISAQPPRAVLCLSLIKLGNKIKDIQMPSINWSYRITLQKLNKENSDKSEVYTGDIQDSGIDENERSSYAPVNISFQRVAAAEIPNSDTIKTVTFQNKSFQILFKGRPCRLIGSPQYIYDVSEIQTLLEIVEKVDANHSYVETTDSYGK